MLTKDLFIIEKFLERRIIGLTFHPEQVSLDQFREIWDTFILECQSFDTNKVFLDLTKTSFSSIENIIYTTEGLVQIMVNQIFFRKLYFAYIIKTQQLEQGKTYSFHSHFNQFGEITYDFFDTRNAAMLWLNEINCKTESIVKRRINFLLSPPRKTTDKDQQRKLDEIFSKIQSKRK